MAIDKSYIGRRYPAAEPYFVGREKIKEFADAIGDPSPVYRDADAARAVGHPDVIAPPTFATVLNIKLVERIIADPDLGVDYARMVHADQRFVHHRPIYAGDQLSIAAHVDDIMNRAGIDTLSVRGEVSAANGEPVSTMYATLVVRGESRS